MHKHDIIFISGDPWNFRWRRRHHVAWNLAKDHRVLFIEPPYTVFQPFREVQLNWRHLLNLGRFKHQGRNLYSYSPIRLLPLSLPGAKRFNYYKIDKQRTLNTLKKIVNKLEFKNPILWVYFHPFQYDYYGLFNEKITVADWFDKFTAPVSYNFKQEDIDRVRNKEDRILKKADIVFSVTKELADDIEPRNKNVYIVKQGVDYQRFNIKTDKNDARLKKIRYIKRPLLGFLGTIHFILDYDLLNHIAEEKPEWSVILIGKKWLKVDEDITSFQNLIRRKNVYYMGELSDELATIYMQKVDVCLMPMKKIEFNRCAGHLKIWDYMALGRPIVAIDQGMKFDCDEFIKKARNKKEFVDAIVDVLEEEKQSGESLTEVRKNIARENSWENCVNKMMKIIELHLDNRNYISNPNSPF